MSLTRTSDWTESLAVRFGLVAVFAYKLEQGRHPDWTTALFVNGLGMDLQYPG